MDTHTAETLLMDKVGRRPRWPTPRYTPVEEPRRRKKRERRKTIVKVGGSPPYSKDQKENVSLFLNTEFGKGYENEMKYSSLKWYNYWNRFARPDYCRSPSLEDKCFVCKGDFDIEEGDLPKVCGISGCPKVYHRKCWDYFALCKSVGYFREGYYQFMENNTVHNLDNVKTLVDSMPDSIGNYKSDDCVCPRHFCLQCKMMSCEGMSYCPTCPFSYCKGCLGTIRETYCRVCVTVPKVLDAPEMKLVF